MVQFRIFRQKIPQHLRDLVPISGAQRAFDAIIAHCDNINILKSRLKTRVFPQALNRYSTIATTIDHRTILAYTHIE